MIETVNGIEYMECSVEQIDIADFIRPPVFENDIQYQFYLVADINHYPDSEMPYKLSIYNQYTKESFDVAANYNSRFDAILQPSEHGERFMNGKDEDVKKELNKANQLYFKMESESRGVR